MKVVYWNEVAQGHSVCSSPSALTIGAFDGPHLGHQALFDMVLRQPDCLKGVVTFFHSPRLLTNDSTYAGHVSTLRLRLEFFERIGFDFVLLIDFSGEFGKMKGSVFLEKLVQFCSMKFLAVGTDFHCGYKKDTGIEQIKELSKTMQFVVSILDPVLLNGQRVSSSLIRSAIARGDFLLVAACLGSPYQLDCVALDWDAGVADQSQVEKTAFNTLVQVLPPVGRYKVCIRVLSSSFQAEDRQDSFVGMLQVDTDFLRCCVPCEYAEAKIQTIIFGYPEE